MSDYNYIHEANSRIDERFEEQLISRVGDALDEEGAEVCIRKMDGRLIWIRDNIHGGSQDWVELTPDLAEDRIKGLKETPMGLKEETLAMLRDRLMQQEPEAYEIGWYQDSKGDLYQFDGKTWVGVVPSKDDKKALEFLGS